MSLSIDNAQVEALTQNAGKKTGKEKGRQPG